MAEQARAFFEDTKHRFTHFFPALAHIQWEQVGPAVLKYIQEHPGLTALQLATFILTLVPGLVAVPALGAVGFGAAGPAAGGMAAGFQSAFGTPLLFRIGQSAAMGGWGAGVVNGVVQGGAVMTGVLGSWFARGNGTGGTSDHGANGTNDNDAPQPPINTTEQDLMEKELAKLQATIDHLATAPPADVQRDGVSHDEI